MREAPVVVTVLLVALCGWSIRAAGQRQPGSDAGQPPQPTAEPARPAADQDRSSPSTEQRRFRPGANLVRVDVYPTRNGQPARDLTAGDFEVLEDGVPQTIETFEHVDIHGPVSQTERREPNAVRQARAMAEDPRSRVFVIFLDTYHTPLAGSHAMQRVLADMLERLIGPDDLFAVMTPRMSATEITLARRTMTLERELAKYWYWGQRDSRVLDDDEDRILRECDLGDGEIIARRHEKLTLDALTDLVTYLRGLREERKAVIAITSGWVLYQPNRALMEPTDPDPLPVPRAGTDPDGRLVRDRDHALAGGYFSRQECEVKRIQLAGLDLRDEFRALLDVANRGNVSFYPLDARGLAAADNFTVAGDDRVQSGQMHILEQKLGAGVVAHYTPLNVDQGMLRSVSMSSARWPSIPTESPSSTPTISLGALAG